MSRFHQVPAIAAAAAGAITAAYIWIPTFEKASNLFLYTCLFHVLMSHCGNATTGQALSRAEQKERYGNGSVEVQIRERSVDC